MTIKENAENILDIVKNSAEKSGRTLEDITVIAVSKTVDSEKARQAIKADGIYSLGENRVQEFTKKIEDLSDEDIDWHLIGHLQKNKVKYIIGKTKLIHSIESLSLVEEIDKRSKKSNLITDVLIEVNMAEEESKFGLNKEEVLPFIEKMKQFDNVKVKGLMTVAPYSEITEQIRWVFKEMKTLFDDIKLKELPNTEFEYLSMGMSNDFEIAIEEGANIIRVGTKIFGERNYDI